MEMLDKVLNLLTGCFPQGFDPAKINSIGLHQVGIELVLADDLAKVIADFGPAVVFISRLWREAGRLSVGLRWGCERNHFFHCRESARLSHSERPVLPAPLA